MCSGFLGFCLGGLFDLVSGPDLFGEVAGQCCVGARWTTGGSRSCVPLRLSVSQASSSGPASPPPAGPASQAFSRTLKAVDMAV